MRLLSADLSLNHGGFIFFNEDKLKYYYFVTDNKSIAEKWNGGTYLPSAKTKDKQQRDVERLGFWDKYLRELYKKVHPNVVVIEDYAYSAKSQSVYQIGEVGGILRALAFQGGSLLRLYDPTAIKMFSVHDGTCDAYETMRSILERWPEARKHFSKYSKGKNTIVTEDLCDAYAAVRLLDTELKLRQGKINLSDLHEKEITVFNRVTKRYPVNILAREWISL